jgi:hypothetical protein
VDPDVMEDFPPLRSGRAPSEVLALTRQRGIVLRRRRLILSRALPAVAVLILLAVPVAIARRSRGPTVRVTTPAVDGTTTTTAGSGSATAAAPTTTTVAPRGSTSPKPAQVTTTTALATTTTQPPVRCTQAESPMAAASDKNAYAPGQSVTVTVRMTNAGHAPCYQPAFSGARVTDASGRAVYELAVAASYGPNGPSAVQSGVSQTTTWQWGQQGCTGSTCSQAPPGSYHIELFFGEYPSVWTSPAVSVAISAGP